MAANAEPMRRTPRPLLTGLLVLNGLALLVLAVWFRCRALDHIPGVNGDEAWYGVQALALLGGEGVTWRTPTGNPINPLFVGPTLLLHTVFPPSIGLLRAVAVLSGLAALAVNAWLCRWVFDRRTAAASTLLLAVLPINIAYSRFAWDASQSVLATLPVLYLALAAVRFPRRQLPWLLATVPALAAAVVVHPANLFAAMLIAPALTQPEFRKWLSQGLAGVWHHRTAVAAFGAILAGMVVGGLLWFGSPAGSLAANRLDGLTQMAEPGYVPAVATRYPRLILGATAYRYLAGTNSWLQWPHLGPNGWGLDVFLFWPALVGAAWVLCHRLPASRVDRALVAGTLLQLAAFLLLAGPRALAPGYERYGLCLVAPAVLLVARAVVVWAGERPARRHAALVVGVLGGWFFLADFDRHYFAFVERTGGEAHRTFRTAPVEPKLAAMRRIQHESRGEPIWIVTSTWWNYWPLRYLATTDPNIEVYLPDEAEATEGFSQASRGGWVWYVEFAQSRQWDRVRRGHSGPKVDIWHIPDYAGRPVLSVLRRGKP